VTRRSLLGTGAALLAGAAGAAAGWFSTHPRRAPKSLPRRSPVLEGELARERSLLAQLDATVISAPELAARIGIVRADHAAHADAIRSLLVTEGVAVSSPSTATTGASSSGPSSELPPTPFVDLAAWVAAETTAAAATASASAQSAGAAAATLASISACESSHVAWLTP
jgi:hypothetical protein